MTEEYVHELKIPKERIAVLIGTDGITKKEIEDATKSKLSIDSKEGDVKVSGTDAILLLSAKEIILAIGRGFNPEIALQLTKQDYCLELINLQDFSRSKNDELRIKGRIIGSEGKSRNTIESLTETYICVYGKTVGMIGEVEKVNIARRAIDMLIKGSPHSNVFRWLENQRRGMKMHEYMGESDFKSQLKDDFKKELKEKDEE